MQQDVHEYFRKCDSCAAVKNSPRKIKVPLQNQVIKQK